MAALDFPASPTNNQVFVAPNGVTYVYSSTYTAWQAQPLSAGYVGDFTAVGNFAPGGTSYNFIFPTVLSGNAGGWYSTSTGRFTPPKGRYRISCGASIGYSAAAIVIGIYLLKNGTGYYSQAGVSQGANNNGYVGLDVEVDSNGTDYWQVQAGNNGVWNLAGNAFFTATPVSPNANMTQGTGDFYGGIFGTGGGVGTTPTTVMYSPSINNGNYYNTSNGRWTPPAGRYMIISNFTGLVASSASLFTNVIRKNGTQIAFNTTQGNPAGVADSCPLNIIVDANGTDWFDQQVYTNAGNSGAGSTVLWFGGFPISGIKGPQGDPGPTGGSGLVMVSEQVLSAPGTTMTVTFPAGVKRVDLDFWWTTSPLVDLSAVVLQGLTSGTPNATAAYAYYNGYMRSDGSTGGSFASNQTSFGIGGWAQLVGNIQFQRPDAGYGVGGMHGTTQAGARYRPIMGFEGQFAAGSFTGYRLTASGGNFATGSFLRCWAAT